LTELAAALPEPAELAGLLAELAAGVVLDELQAAVISTVLATTAPAVITRRARKVPSQAATLRFQGGERKLLARQVEIMTSQVERKVSYAGLSRDLCRASWYISEKSRLDQGWWC
jgi:hypothetical protein